VISVYEWELYIIYGLLYTPARSSCFTQL